jgi:pimeloyl-ACP methyl ester carboxylesterase
MEEFRHIRIDLPGFGASPPPAAEWSMADYARQAAEVLDHLGIERSVLAGISMGGYIVMQMIRDMPERLDGLMLLDTRERADSDQIREDRYKTIAEIEKNGTKAIVESMLPKMIANEARRNTFRKIMMTASPRGMVTAQRAMAARPDSTDTLRNVRVPTLIVVGDRDPITPVEDAQRMASLIPGSALVVIQDAAHASNFDQPDQFNRAAIDFFRMRFGSN